MSRSGERGEDDPDQRGPRLLFLMMVCELEQGSFAHEVQTHGLDPDGKSGGSFFLGVAGQEGGFHRIVVPSSGCADDDGRQKPDERQGFRLKVPSQLCQGSFIRFRVCRVRIRGRGGCIESGSRELRTGSS